MKSLTSPTATFESLDDVQNWALTALLDHGSPVTTRGMPTLELFPVSFTLTRPRRRCITNPERRWNLPLAIGEFCWHATGSNDVRFIEYYAPRWREFTDGIEILGSCYGHHIFSRKDGNPSQWERLVRLLRTERHSRRAVLQLFTPHPGLDPDAKDAPCTCSVQFLVRNDQLHTIVYMRSNDSIWGLPYDVFLFTMLQELLAIELGTELGLYHHFVGSLHLYRRHFELARRIIACPSRLDYEMPPMEAHIELPSFLKLEERIRAKISIEGKTEGLHPYWRDLLDVLQWYSARKLNRAAASLPGECRYASLLNSTSPMRTRNKHNEGDLFAAPAAYLSHRKTAVPRRG
jgi:thymidylate synthase